MCSMKKGAQTRSRILDESAALFAAGGFAGTSVRQIADAAGVNVAAVSMYFHSKEGLYRTILDEGLDTLVECRRAALAAYRDTETPELTGVLHAFVEPLFVMLDGTPRDAAFLRILSRTLFEPDATFQSSAALATQEIFEEFVSEIADHEEE